jgi:hypothetical protein
MTDLIAGDARRPCKPEWKAALDQMAGRLGVQESVYVLLDSGVCWNPNEYDGWMVFYTGSRDVKLTFDENDVTRFKVEFKVGKKVSYPLGTEALTAAQIAKEWSPQLRPATRREVLKALGVAA